MSKVVSLILVLVLFFGPVVNSFADKTEEANIFDGDNSEALYIIVAAVVLGGLLIWGLVAWVKNDFKVSEAENIDDGIRLVSSEDEVPSVNKDGKTILNVLKHVEAGVTPNKDVYVGLRFQY
jgi:hypothetical protein